MGENFELSAEDRAAFEVLVKEMPGELDQIFDEALAAKKLRESVAAMPPLPPEKHFSILYAFFGACSYVKVYPVRPEVTEAQKLQGHATQAFRRIEKQLDRDIRTWNNQAYSND